MLVINRADVVALIHAINHALINKSISLEMQLEPEDPPEVAVQTEHGLVTLRFSVLAHHRFQLTIFSDRPEVARALEGHYARLRNVPGEPTKSDSSQLRFERSTGGVFAIFHGLREGANYYITISLPD